MTLLVALEGLAAQVPAVLSTPGKGRVLAHAIRLRILWSAANLRP